jgi:dGTPase
MEHVLYVNAISNTIVRTLSLNQDLVNAISLGHDLGHAPFGHSGERALDNCVNKINNTLRFRHEYHSLRVVDRLATRMSNEKINEKCGLNLTYEVRDGIVSHCGENYEEYKLYKDSEKRAENIYTDCHRDMMPATLEGCIVRLVDKVAYVGRDIEDAVRAKLIDFSDIPKDIRSTLGSKNGDVINTLVLDMLENSYDSDYIQLSDEKGLALRDLIKENSKLIYNSEMISRYEKTVTNTIEGLFGSLYQACKDIEKMKNTDNSVIKNFYGYIIEKDYGKEELPEQIVLDYVAGMTDGYAIKCYEELYWI